MSDYFGKTMREAKRVIVCVDGETGHAPFVALSAFIQDKKPIGYILSRFMRQDPLNTVPDFDGAGWPVYDIGKDTLAVVIRGFHSPESTGLGSNTIWTYYYPVMKGLVEIMGRDHFKCRSLDFLNTTSVHQYMPDELFEQLPNDRCHVTSFEDGEMVRDDGMPQIFLHSPAWCIPWLFSYVGKVGQIFTVGFDEDNPEAVDITAAHTLAQTIQAWTDIPRDNAYMEKVAAEINEVDDAEQEMMRKVFNQQSDRKNGSDVGGMFG